MVQALVSKGVICTEAVIEAFKAVDRGHFIDPPPDVGANEEVRFFDMPFRNGVQHLSAPGIYGVALEALDLADGMSFLNVCSGTGYISAVAAQILGKKAVHSAIELRGELVSHARTKLRELGLHHVDFRHGSCLEIDPSSSMRFARIYVGAGADEALASNIFSMLELGGVLVGPFASSDGSQRLLRVRRLSESSFQVRELMHVQFTPLLVSLPHDELRRQAVAAAAVTATATAPNNNNASAATPPAALAAALQDLSHEESGNGDAPRPVSPGMKRRRSSSNSISIEPPSWSVETHERFPVAHRQAVVAALLVHQHGDSLLSKLPKEVLVQEILPKLEYAAFGPLHTAPDDVAVARAEEDAIGVAAAASRVDGEGEEAEDEEAEAEEEPEDDDGTSEMASEGEDVDEPAQPAQAVAASSSASSSTRASRSSTSRPPVLTRAAMRLLRCL